jgi:integrase
VRGSIEHRPDRSAAWRARYRGPDGVFHSRSFDRKIDAERWLRATLAKIDRGEWVDPAHGTIAWCDYSAQLLASRTHLSPRTVETDRLCQQRAIGHIGNVPLVRLTPELLRTMIADLTTAGYAPETVAKTLRWVRLTLNQAVMDRRILSSPAQGLRLPRVRRSNMRILTPDQVASLAQALPDRYTSLVTVAAYTGLRWGELAGLRVSDIDLLRRRLTVRTALIEASGHPPQLGTPKTSTSERTITLPKIVVDTLAEHLEHHPPHNGIIWTTQQGAFLRRGSFGRIWRQAVTDTIGPPCRIHDLRHTHAAWLIAAGEHPKTIQTRLGHSSIQVTIDRYGHLMDGLDTQTADRLDTIAQTVHSPRMTRDPPVIGL